MSGIRDCLYCNGTGQDHESWNGLCPMCDGLGEVDEDNDEVSHADEDEDGPLDLRGTR